MEKEETHPLPFPLKGVDSQEGLTFQPEGTTPEGVNVRACEPGALRVRGGARTGLVRYIDQQVVGADSVQGLGTIITSDGDAVEGNGTTFFVDINGATFTFRAVQVAHGNTLTQSAGRDITSGTYPYPPLYPRDSNKTYVVYLSGTDNNDFPIYVNGVTSYRMQFVGSQVPTTVTVTPSDYQAATYTINGAVFELKNGVEEAIPSLNFTKTGQSVWKLPFFAYQTSAGKIGFKDNVLSAGATATGAFDMAGVCTSATTWIAYPYNPGTSYTDCGICVYTPPATPTLPTTSTVGAARTTWSVCSDGTSFFCAGISSGGGVALAKIQTDGTVVWSSSNAGGFSLGHAPGHPTDVDDDTQGSSIVCSGSSVYVNIPQYGVIKYAKADGSLTSTLITNASLAAAFTGYRNATANFDAHPPMMAVVGSYLAVAMQTSTRGYSSGCTHGIAFVDLSTGAVHATVTGLGPSSYPLILASDGTSLYVVIPENSGANMNTAGMAKYTTGGVQTWSVLPFATNGPNTNNREAMIYISGSTQLFAGNNYETLVMSPTDGSVTRRIAALSAPPEWLTDAGSA